MKKLYSFCICLTLALVAALSASALNVTVIVDNPDAVKIGKKQLNTSNWSTEFVPLVDEVTEVNNFEVNEGSSFYIIANDNYVMTSITDNKGNENVLGGASLESSLYVDDDKTYIVTTKSLDDINTASCTINVDDPSKVQFRTGGSLSRQFTLTENSYVLKFDPVSANANQLQISSAVYGQSLYEVKQNGKTVEPFYGSYTITLTDGDVIDVTATIPDKDVTLTIEVPEGCEDVISSVQNATSYPYADVQGNFFTGVTFKAGTPLAISFNSEKYSIDNMSVNGVSQSVYGSYSFTIMDNTTIKVDAHEYQNFSVPFDFDDFTHVIMKKGQYSYGQEYELTDNSCSFNFNEKSDENHSVYIQAAAGFFIRKIILTQEDGTETVYNSGASLILTPGCSVKVITGVKDEACLINIWLDEAAAADITKIELIEYGSTVASCDEPVAGSNVISYKNAVADGSDHSFYVSLTRSGNNTLYVSVNGADAQEYYGYTYVYTNQMRGNDIIRFFSEMPAQSVVSFSAGDIAHSDFTITVDGIEIDEWENNNLFNGSEVTITSNNAGSFNVSLNDAAAEPATGKYSFIVSEPASVKISYNSDAIQAVEAENADAARVVYNLQGIRISSDNLPAGVYIINGRKVAVK